MNFIVRAHEKGLIIREQAVLAPFTYFKIGGPADFLSQPKTNEEFITVVRLAQEMQIPITILGGGGNVLIADKGIRGLVIHPENRQYTRAENVITAGAGTTNGQLLGFATTEGLAGLENIAGVPGTIGGTVYGNGGMFPSGIEPVLSHVRIVNEAGEEQEFSKQDCALGYRTSRFKRTKEVIIEASFLLYPKDTKVIAAEIRRLIATYKRGVQPIGAACSGCMFKNPTGDYAARLIDAAGLKGKRIGGAEVSPLHANFIINTGDATADHVLQLVSYIKQQIRDAYGVQLQEEVQYLGF
ncbi:MAG: UDP-N-acetylmuramate dehydrogenase [Patescibacteria group bacterium]|jgi:UDP-N-acetylmuramate dehydrogenase